MKDDFKNALAELRRDDERRNLFIMLGVAITVITGLIVAIVILLKDKCICCDCDDFDDFDDYDDDYEDWDDEDDDDEKEEECCCHHHDCEE